MRKPTRISIIIVSTVLLLVGSVWGAIEYSVHLTVYPYDELIRIKTIVPQDSKKAFSRFMAILDKIEDNEHPPKHYSFYEEYIVNYLEVIAINECKDSVASEIDFLHRLWKSDNEQVRKMVQPYIIYERVRNTRSIKDIRNGAVEFMKILGENAQFENKSERFGLLICNIMDSLNPNDTIRDILLNKIKLNLVKTNYKQEKKQIWQQYMLTYCYYLDCKALESKSENSDTLKSLLTKITNTLPVKTYSKFQYEELIMGQPIKGLALEQANYYLKLENKEKAYQVLTDLIAKNPFMYYDVYMNFYENNEDKKLSNNGWLDCFAKFMPSVSNVRFTSLEGDVLDLSQKRDKWVLVDFWGTWCAPCVKQLPEIQSFYDRNKNVIDVFTISKGTENIESFLTRNNYTFPVASVEEIEGFDIRRFPTKILISPTGNYIKIPNNNDWVGYIARITGLKVNK